LQRASGSGVTIHMDDGGVDDYCKPRRVGGELVIEILLDAYKSCIIEHWDESQLQEQQRNHSSGKRWLSCSFESWVGSSFTGLGCIKFCMVWVRACRSGQFCSLSRLFPISLTAACTVVPF
jgi:hypothetical protein